MLGKSQKAFRHCYYSYRTVRYQPNLVLYVILLQTGLDLKNYRCGPSGACEVIKVQDIFVVLHTPFSHNTVGYVYATYAARHHGLCERQSEKTVAVIVGHQSSYHPITINIVELCQGESTPQHSRPRLLLKNLRINLIHIVHPPSPTMLVGRVITRTCLHHSKAVVALREIPMAVMARHATTVAATETSSSSSSSRRRQQEDLVKATIHRMIMEQEERHHFQENNSSSSATSNSTVVVTEEALQKASHCLRVSNDSRMMVYHPFV